MDIYTEYSITERTPQHWDGESPYSDIQTCAVVWTQEHDIGGNGYASMDTPCYHVMDQEDFLDFYPFEDLE